MDREALARSPDAVPARVYQPTTVTHIWRPAGRVPEAAKSERVRAYDHEGHWLFKAAVYWFTARGTEITGVAYWTMPDVLRGRGRVRAYVRSDELPALDETTRSWLPGSAREWDAVVAEAPCDHAPVLANLRKFADWLRENYEVAGHSLTGGDMKRTEYVVFYQDGDAFTLQSDGYENADDAARWIRDNGDEGRAYRVAALYPPCSIEVETTRHLVVGEAAEEG